MCFHAHRIALRTRWPWPLTGNLTPIDAATVEAGDKVLRASATTRARITVAHADGVEIVSGDEVVKDGDAALQDSAEVLVATEYASRRRGYGAHQHRHDREHRRRIAVDIEGDAASRPPWSSLGQDLRHRRLRREGATLTPRPTPTPSPAPTRAAGAWPSTAAPGDEALMLDAGSALIDGAGFGADDDTTTYWRR